MLLAEKMVQNGVLQCHLVPKCQQHSIEISIFFCSYRMYMDRQKIGKGHNPHHPKSELFDMKDIKNHSKAVDRYWRRIQNAKLELF